MLEDYLSKGGTVPQGPIANSRSGAEDGTRTRDPDLGKVVLYQLSYFRVGECKYTTANTSCNRLLVKKRAAPEVGAAPSNWDFEIRLTAGPRAAWHGRLR